LAIELYWIGDQDKRELMSISNETWRHLSKPIGYLKKKTGIWIDPHSDTRLSPDGATLLLEAINSAGTSYANDHRDLLKLLELSAKEDQWILFVGD